MARLTAAGSRRSATGGVALVMVLIAVAVISLATLVPLRNEKQAVQRERERELLFIGDQFRQALASYAAATPGGVPQFPHSLDELVEDKRFPHIRRHLRRVYVDPMTGLADWALIKEQGAIRGVASRSTRMPLKHSGFSAKDREFATAASYAEWKFAPSAISNVGAPNAEAGTPPLPAASMPAGTPTIPTVPTEPPPAVDPRIACHRALTSASNLCLQHQETAAECRRQAGEIYRACLRGG